MLEQLGRQSVTLERLPTQLHETIDDSLHPAIRLVNSLAEKINQIVKVISLYQPHLGGNEVETSFFLPKFFRKLQTDFHQRKVGNWLSNNLPCQHFKNEYTQSPPIHGFCVP
jgi:hypothetical protein